MGEPIEAFKGARANGFDRGFLNRRAGDNCLWKTGKWVRLASMDSLALPQPLRPLASLRASRRKGKGARSCLRGNSLATH